MVTPVLNRNFDVVINDRWPPGALKAIISGDRCFWKEDFERFYKNIANVGYAIEMLMAKYMVQKSMKIGVVHLKDVKQTLQTEKDGVSTGIFSYIKIWLRIFGFINPLESLIVYLKYRRRIKYINE
jgi:hypothetical protein